MKLLLLLYVIFLVWCTHAQNDKKESKSADKRSKHKDYDSTYKYEDFERQFGRSYKGEERRKHKEAFEAAYAEIQRMRADPNVDFDVKINDLADWTDEELDGIFYF